MGERKLKKLFLLRRGFSHIEADGKITANRISDSPSIGSRSRFTFFSGISRLATVDGEENGIEPDNEKVNWMPSTKLKPDTSASNKSRKKASKAVGKSFSEKFETACDCKSFLFSLLTEICADRQMLQPGGAASPRELPLYLLTLSSDWRRAS